VIDAEDRVVALWTVWFIHDELIARVVAFFTWSEALEAGELSE
jgi:hypothetical protein